MTHVLPDTDVLQELDFEPSCGWHNLTVNKDCGVPAKWCAILPCCGHVVLFCHGHANNRDDLFQCLGCEYMHETRLGWRWHFV